MENELEALRVLTIKEAAIILRMSQRTVQRFIQHKDLASFKVVDSGACVRAKWPNGLRLSNLRLSKTGKVSSFLPFS
jgi:hypothetical protein